MFANGPADLGSILGRVIPKTQKWYLMPPCLTLSIIRYRSRVKWTNPGKGVAPSPTPWCSNYRNGSLGVTLDFGRQLYSLTRFVKWKKKNSFLKFYWILIKEIEKKSSFFLVVFYGISTFVGYLMSNPVYIYNL